MRSMILGLLAETSIHPGTGRDLGVIDLPVSREAATDYPVLVGSGVKGAFRDAARLTWKNTQADDYNDPNIQREDTVEVTKLFGKQDEAGQILFSDARLLLLPIRSLTGQYRWVTCPHILERLRRDVLRVSGTDILQVDETGDAKPITIPSAGEGLRSALANDAIQNTNFPKLFLEEWQFSVTGSIPNLIFKFIKSLVKHEQTKARIAKQLVILSNDDFAWFARYGLSVQARNVLDVEKKTSKNLWYEETLPPDTLMYSILQERKSNTLQVLQTMFNQHPYIQLGGNETVGQGWFAIQPISYEKSTSSNKNQKQESSNKGKGKKSKNHRGGRR